MMVMDIKSGLQGAFKGDLDTSPETLDFYSHDASLFEMRPEIVAFPKDADDVKAAVQYVLANKATNPNLSITPRSAGTDMSGGAIGESIVLDVNRHMNEIFEVTADSAHVQPGRFFREFDEETKKFGSILPSYPASRNLASVGGMVSNNSGGELGVSYGKTQRYVEELSIVLGDGNEYVVKPLNKAELDVKMAQGDYEGELYRQTYELIEAHYDEIKAAKPKVVKDSTGYRLWDIWDRETGVFDLTQLFIGAQGTIGIITDIKFKLVPDPMAKKVGTLVVYVRDMENFGKITQTVMSQDPFAVEVFDDKTLKLAFKFIFAFLTRMSFWQWAMMCLRLIPNGLALAKGFPRLVLLIEFNADTQEEVNQRVRVARDSLKQFKNISYMEEASTYAKADKFWKIRQESFNLLRSKVKDRHTAPYIDDFTVPIDTLEEVIPKINDIVEKYDLMGTLAGHLGDGNFHVIPLMKIEDPEERAKIEPSMKDVYDVVLEYGGSISGEHNDGLVRGPWLERMYGPVIVGYMHQVKQLYDPQNIFNPKKKTDATWEYSFSKIRGNFDD